jgi:hypothetical protein
MTIDASCRMTPTRIAGVDREIVGISVARRAGQVVTRRGDREVGRVIPRGCRPIRRRMAGLTRGRETGRRMPRSGRAGVISLVARIAARRRPAIISGRRVT